MADQQHVVGVEINPKFVGAFFTEHQEDLLRLFCFYMNGEVGRFDLPAKENQDSLRQFFTNLDIEETCSSFINDEVVRGRFYVRTENNYWLYTLLASPANMLPVTSADICSLPWNVCWRSPEAEVLEYGTPGEPVHCFAVRTVVTESDASRLLRQSKAFLNPIVVQKNRSHKRLCLSAGVGLVLLILPLMVTLFGMRYQAAHATARPAANTVSAVESSVAPRGNYYLLNNNQVTGPYPLNAIVQMQASGRLNIGVICRAEKSTK